MAGENHSGKTGHGERTKHHDSALKGKAVEHLVAASCIVASGAELNVSTSFVDDEGVDLVFHRRGSSATLAVQVKSRFIDHERLANHKWHFMQNVRGETFEPRPDLYVLFVAVNGEEGDYGPVWLVPSEELAERIRPGHLGRRRFAASISATSRDQWRPYRLERRELPVKLLKILTKLETSPHS